MEYIEHLTTTLDLFVRHYGAFAVGLILAIEALGAPAPGESLLIFASVLAARGEMSLPGLLFSAWIGSVTGDNIGYAIGRTLGRATISRYGEKIGLTKERMGAIEGVFRRYGGATVLFARFFNILRQLNGIVAGTLEMPWWRFLFFNAVGAALWVAAWVAAGTFFSEHLKDVRRLAHHTWLLVPILAVACLILFLLFSRKRQR